MGCMYGTDASDFSTLPIDGAPLMYYFSGCLIFESHALFPNSVVFQAGDIVLSEPEVRQVTLPATGGRVIIASDGLWDAVTPKTAAHHVRGLPATKAARELGQVHLILGLSSLLLMSSLFLCSIFCTCGKYTKYSSITVNTLVVREHHPSGFVSETYAQFSQRTMHCSSMSQAIKVRPRRSVKTSTATFLSDLPDCALQAALKGKGLRDDITVLVIDLVPGDEDRLPAPLMKDGSGNLQASSSPSAPVNIYHPLEDGEAAQTVWRHMQWQAPRLLPLYNYGYIMLITFKGSQETNQQGASHTRRLLCFRSDCCHRRGEAGD